MSKESLRRSALFAAVYVVVCAAYIVVSGRLAASMTTSQEHLAAIELFKGIAFVLVTGLVLFALTLLHLERIRKHEELLRRGEQRYRDLINTTKDIVFSVTPDGVLRFIGPQVQRYGFSVEELVPRPFSEFIFPEDRDAVLNGLQRTLTTGEQKLITFRVVAKDGSIVWFQEIGQTVRDGGGSIVSISGVLRDVTEHKRVQDALQDSQQMLHAILESTREWIWVLDISGCHTYSNHAVEAILGYTPKEFRGMGLELIHPEDRPIVDAKWPEWIADGTGWQDVALRWRTKEGDYRYLESSAAPIFNQQGEFDGFVGVDRDITERKRAEEDLRRSQAQLSNALRIAEAGHWEYDVATDTFTFNDNFYRILQTTAEEAGGYTMSSADYARRFCHPEDMHMVSEEIQAALETDEASYSNQLEHRILYANGETGHVAVRFFITKDAAGQTVKIFGVNQDITERRRAEESIRRSERKFRSLFEQAGDYILLLSPVGEEGHFVVSDVNESACKMHGYTKDEFLGMPLCQIDAELSHEQIREKLGEVLAGEMLVVEAAHRRKDGSVFPIEATVRLLDVGEGPPLLLSVERDITARKRVEAALHESRELLQAVLNAMPVRVFWKDRDLAYLGCNQAFASDAGFDRPEDLLGKDDYAMGWRDQAELYRSDDRAVLESGEARLLIEESQTTPTGEEIYLLTSKVPLRDDQGEIIGVLGTYLDVTEQRLAQQQQARLERQIRQAQKMEAVGRLAGGVAHDFNNLLMGIMGYAELCRDEVGENHPVRQWVDEITNEAQRSAQIVRQLLAFARREAIAPQMLDVNDSVGGMLKMLRRLIGEDIELTWSPGAGVWPVEMDPGHVDQLLANLCVNARDAIESAGKVTVETKNATIGPDYAPMRIQATPGDYVVLMVTDTGCGMSEDTLTHIFEPFYTTKDVGKGTGLGLATVHGIVKQYDGGLDVLSGPSSGTTFQIYLPRVSETVVEEELASGEGVTPLGGTEHVLLVEDEKSLRVTCQLFLEALGYTVLTAAEPEKALQLADQFSTIDLLITDMVMPGMTGHELAKSLMRARPELKCLFMSGYTADIIADRVTHETGAAFLGKPFTRDDLAREVRRILDE